MDTYPPDEIANPEATADHLEGDFEGDVMEIPTISSDDMAVEDLDEVSLAEESDTDEDYLEEIFNDNEVKKLINAKVK